MFLDLSPWVGGKECRLGDGGGVGGVKKTGVYFKIET